MSVRLSVSVLLPMLILIAAGNLSAASVKPLEVFSEKILVLEIEHLSADHSLNSTLLRRAVDRLNRELNIMSKATAGESLKLLADVSERLSAAVKSSEDLSRYLTTNSARLKADGHGRYLPLAEMDKDIEGAYFNALASFIKTAHVFVQYCYDNSAAISSGSQKERKRYDELYAAYLKDAEIFNTQSIARSQLLAEMGTDHYSLWELMPR